MSSVKDCELDPALKMKFIRHHFSVALSEIAPCLLHQCRHLSSLSAGKDAPMKIWQRPITLIPEDRRLQLQPLSWRLEFRQAGVRSATSRSGKPSAPAGSPSRPAASTKKLGPVKGRASGALPYTDYWCRPE